MDDRNEYNEKRWNVYSLKEYFDMAIAKMDEKIEQRFCAVKEAVDKADKATEKRFEGVNEFRNTLGDQQRTFIPRREFEISIESLSRKIVDIEKHMDKIGNMKAGGNVVLAYIISAISFVVAIVSLILKFGNN